MTLHPPLNVVAVVPLLGEMYALTLGAAGGGGAFVTETVSVDTTFPFTLNPALYVPAVNAS